MRSTRSSATCPAGLEAGAIALGEVAEGGRVFAGEEGGFASESVNPKIAAPAPHIRSQLLHRRFHADPFGPSRDFSASLLKRIQGLGRHNALNLRAGSKAEPQKFPLLRRKNPSRIQCSRKRTVPRAPNRFNPHKGRVTPAASFKRSHRKRPGSALIRAVPLHTPGHFRMGPSVHRSQSRSGRSASAFCEWRVIRPSLEARSVEHPALGALQSSYEMTGATLHSFCRHASQTKQAQWEPYGYRSSQGETGRDRSGAA